MKRRIAIDFIDCFIAIVLVLSVNYLDRTFVQGVESYTNLIIPEYKRYVEQDLKLSPDTKRIRKQSADKLQELINKAKGDERP